MKKYVFRLETVRRVRQAEQNIAKSQLLLANTEVSKATALVEERLAEYEAAQVSTGTGTVAGAEQFMQRRYFNELSGLAVTAAKASRSAALLEAAAKRDMYTEAAKRVRALERLDDRRRSEHALEMQRQETLEVDDIVTGRHMRPDSKNRAAG